MERCDSIIILDDDEYNELMDKLDNDDYIPSYNEENTLYSYDGEIFFIVRRFKHNYLIYKQN